eukprot:TRINITY_DN3110_c0_g1_i1.p1 TRINITY_DN3110_c0_g1~~TRINITY_DN3110_c0_g1_i1.p1  ORF type:complete len:163 (+),score=52.07 TRINITY_DN3110_c0_g1_i1:58-489(+)
MPNEVGDVPPPTMHDYNTGPKGVIADYKEAKEKMIKRLEQERQQKLQIIEQSTFQVKTLKDEEEEKKNQMEDEDDEDFLKKYRQQKMEEFRKQKAQVTQKSNPMFGRLIQLSRADFVSFVEQENHDVLIIIHLHENVEKQDFF